MPADMRALLADLRAESDDLDAMIAPLDQEQYLLDTPAEGWCISDQVSHLAFRRRCRPPPTLAGSRSRRRR